jgi:hypothetical protein
VPVDDAVDKLHRFFRPRLFRRIPVNTKDENTIGGFYERGILHPIWISLFYHFSVVLILVGCVITFLFAFEGDVTIFDDKPVLITTVSDDTKWHNLFAAPSPNLSPNEEGEERKWGDVPYYRKFELGLKKFEIKYTRKPRIKNFPRKGFSKRIKEILKKGNLSLYTKEDSYYPMEYSSQLVINDPAFDMDEEVLIRVNEPLRYRGLTFYQVAYDYRFDLLANGEEVEIGEEGTFALPGIDGEFEQGRIIAGKLVEVDGSISSIQSFVTVHYTPPEKDEEASASGGEEFKIIEGIEQEIKGVKVKVENLRAGTILSYRHDPGLTPLWIGAPILFFAMLFRAWGRWYRVSYVIEKAGEGANLYLNIHKTGIWGDEERLLSKLQNAIGASHGDDGHGTHN